MQRSSSFRTRVTAAACVLSATVLVQALDSRPALAGFTSCVSDPTILLSNGAIVDLQATIGDSYGSSDVRSVVYNVRVPSGLNVVSVVKTGGILGLSETVKVAANDAYNTFDTSTTVYTKHAASVDAVTTTVSALGLTLGTAAASGTNGQSLIMHYSSLL